MVGLIWEIFIAINKNRQESDKLEERVEEIDNKKHKKLKTYENTNRAKQIELYDDWENQSEESQNFKSKSLVEIQKQVLDNQSFQQRRKSFGFALPIRRDSITLNIFNPKRRNSVNTNQNPNQISPFFINMEQLKDIQPIKEMQSLSSSSDSESNSNSGSSSSSNNKSNNSKNGMNLSKVKSNQHIEQRGSFNELSINEISNSDHDFRKGIMNRNITLKLDSNIFNNSLSNRLEALADVQKNNLKIQNEESVPNRINQIKKPTVLKIQEEEKLNEASLLIVRDNETVSCNSPIIQNSLEILPTFSLSPKRKARKTINGAMIMNDIQMFGSEFGNGKVLKRNKSTILGEKITYIEEEKDYYKSKILIYQEEYPNNKNDICNDRDKNREDYEVLNWNKSNELENSLDMKNLKNPLDDEEVLKLKNRLLVKKKKTKRSIV